MDLKRTLAGGVIAAALTAGMASGALAETSSATLEAGAGTNICALSVNGGNPFNFGTYTYTAGEYLQGTARDSDVDFTVVVTTDDHPTDCQISVSGTNLTFSTYSIPVDRIGLAQNGGLIGVNPISALTTGPQVLIPDVGGDPLGNGTANVTTTLTLTSADDNNAPGTYSGTITFTSAPDVP